MRTKLSLMMVALLPFAVFGQSVAKKSVHPMSQKAPIAKASIKGTASAPNAYCIPVDLDCTDGDNILNVTFGTINNTSTCGTGGYNDFTSKVATVVPGASMPISVTVGGGWQEKVSVWIDANNDEVFSADELVSDPTGGIGGGGQGVTLTDNITIPASLAPGSYRMRLLLVAVGSSNPAPDDPCEDGNYGEVEDYTVTVAASGCLTAPNGQYPSTTFTPVCNGAEANVTGAAYTGEFSKVNVVAGTTYTFSSSVATHFITIANDGGTQTLAAGTGSVTYTPTANGVVRFYTHLSSNCDYTNTLHAKKVKCGTPPVEPDYGCDQTYDGVWDLANNITNLSATQNFVVANDFFVPKESGSYKIQSITTSVVPLAGQGDIASVNVKIMTDNAGTPGAVIHTLNNIIPTITPLTQTFANYATFNLTMDMGNYELPVNAAEDTRYWVSVQVNSAAGQSTYWIGYKYTEGWVTKPNYQSTDGGATYAIIVDTNQPGQKFDSNWSIDADCATQAVSETKNREVSFYPNPVKDFLNISSKTKIETVHVYNVAGQKMKVSSALVNGKIDMSKLAPGVYIVSTILEGGKNESFKVVKQ